MNLSTMFIGVLLLIAAAVSSAATMPIEPLWVHDSANMQMNRRFKTFGCHDMRQAETTATIALPNTTSTSGFLIDPIQSQVILWGRNYISLIDVYLSARWSINTNATYGSPIVHWKNKMVYYRDSTPAMRAVSFDTGAHVWSFEAANLAELDVNLLIDDENGGKLVVAMKNTVVMLSARTGAVLREYAVPPNYSVLRMSASNDSRIIITTLKIDEKDIHWNTQEVHCVDANSGKLLWVSQIGSKGLNAYASAINEEEKLVYFVSNTDSFAMSLQDGSLVWHHEEAGMNLFSGDTKAPIKYSLTDFGVNREGLVVAFQDATATYVKVVNKNGIVWRSKIADVVNFSTKLFVDASGFVFTASKTKDNRVIVSGLDSIGTIFADYEVQTSASAETVALPFGLFEDKGCTAILAENQIIALCERE